MTRHEDVLVNLLLRARARAIARISRTCVTDVRNLCTNLEWTRDREMTSLGTDGRRTSVFDGYASRGDGGRGRASEVTEQRAFVLKRRRGRYR